MTLLENSLTVYCILCFWKIHNYYLYPCDVLRTKNIYSNYTSPGCHRDIFTTKASAFEC